MRSLSILPRRADDEVTGELRAKLYRAKLGHLPHAVLSHLAERALERCDWFPSIRECLEIVAEWTNADAQARGRAEYRIRRELHERLDEALMRLRLGTMAPDEVAALPNWIKKIGEVQGLLWRWPDGSFTARRVDDDAGKYMAWLSRNAG